MELKKAYTEVSTNSTLNNFSKKDCHELVEKLLVDGELNEREQLRLLKFFVPKVSVKKDMKAWTALACSKDNTRKVLKSVYYSADNRELVASDGRRVHVIKTDLGESDLCLEPKGLKQIEPQGIFPNYKMIIPNYTSENSVQYTDFQVVNTCKDYCKVVAGGFEVSFTTKFLNDILAGMKKPVLTVAMDGGAVRPALFTDSENPEIKAVLMPLK